MSYLQCDQESDNLRDILEFSCRVMFFNNVKNQCPSILKSLYVGMILYVRGHSKVCFHNRINVGESFGNVEKTNLFEWKMLLLGCIISNIICYMKNSSVDN